MKRNIKSNQSTAGTTLRCRAEELLRNRNNASVAESNQDAQRLIHELAVHQLELEMQNTELRHARDEVERTLEEYTDLYDFAPVGYLTLDREGIIKSINLTAAKLLGVERSKLLGRRFRRFIGDISQAAFAEFLKKTLENQFQAAIEMTLLSADRVPVFVQVGAATVSSGEKCRIALTDITQRKLLEDKLRESEQNYRELVENANSVIVRWKADGTLTYFNEYAQHFFGYSAAEALGRHVNFLLPEQESSTGTDLFKLTKDIVTHPDRFIFNVNENICHDGRRVWMAWTNKAVLDANGQVKEVLGIATDITALHIYETELVAAKLAAEKANQAKSDFLANMSHDIRTPMTVFLMAIQQLQQNEIDPASRKLLKLADNSANALRELVDDILDFSKIEACRVRLHEEPFDLRICVHEVAEMFSLAAREKRLRLTETVAPDVPTSIVADQGRLKQVLINLISNALKFTSQGGVEVSVSLAGDALMFAVADTGIGIPDDKQHLLFQIFSQVDNTFQRHHRGSGLGLAICKGLVELMGGIISMRNREGGGSIFTFTLPLKPLAEKLSPEDTIVDERLGAPIRPVRILLAEDEPMVREIFSIAMNHRGWRVETAVNGSEALARWQSEPFDVILMDLQMPGMNGLEAVRTIRAAESATGRRIAIIALTAHASERIIEECIAAGMDYVLSKPLHFDELAGVINQCLADKSDEVF